MSLPRLPRDRHRPHRDRQRGNSLLLALIVMSALATLGSLTVVSMQSSLKTATNDRAQEIAMYAAESGAAVAMDFLRRNFADQAQPGAGWSNYVLPNNAGVVNISNTLIPSSGAVPTNPNNLFTADQSAWYEIQLYNNRDDPGFGLGAGSNDTDSKIIIRSTGHGPQGSVAIIEWEVQRTDYTRGWGGGPPGAPTPGFPFPAAASLPLPPTFPWTAFDAPLITPGTPGVTAPGTGMVLLNWHIVSL